MRLLLDTHIAYWLVLAPARLLPRELDVLREASGAPAYPAVSIWEIRLKGRSLHPSGARKGPVSPEGVLAALRKAEFEELPLTAQDAATELFVALPHNDPFDELLLVQAQRHGLRLLTRDRKLAEHPFAVTG